MYNRGGKGIGGAGGAGARSAEADTMERQNDALVGNLQKKIDSLKSVGCPRSYGFLSKALSRPLLFRDAARVVSWIICYFSVWVLLSTSQTPLCLG